VARQQQIANRATHRVVIVHHVNIDTHSETGK
jgi:hypothetical protein